MNVKIRNKFIEIKYRFSNGLVIFTVPLTKIVTKSTFVQRSRSNHTFESIGSVLIISQSSISPISSFIADHLMVQIIHIALSIHSFHKNTKSKNGRNSQKCTKCLMRFLSLFIQFIYSINAIISYFLIVPIGISLGVLNFTSVVKQSQKNKM